MERVFQAGERERRRFFTIIIRAICFPPKFFFREIVFIHTGGQSEIPRDEVMMVIIIFHDSSFLRSPSSRNPVFSRRGRTRTDRSKSAFRYRRRQNPDCPDSGVPDTLRLSGLRSVRTPECRTPEYLLLRCISSLSSPVPVPTET